MSRPKYYDAMVKDWLFWCQLARDLSTNVHELKASATSDRKGGRLLDDNCEEVLEAWGVVRRERECPAVELAIRGKTRRQMHKILQNRSYISISDELEWACNRLESLAKEALEFLVLTLQENNGSF